MNILTIHLDVVSLKKKMKIIYYIININMNDV